MRARWIPASFASLAITVASANAAPVQARELSPPVEIRIDDAMVDKDDVQAWAERAVTDGLAAAKVEPEANDRRLIIQIGGELYDFDITVGVKQGDAWVAEKKQSLCECGAQKFVDRLRAEVEAIAPLLRASAEGDAPAPVVDAPRPSAASSRDHAPSKAPNEAPKKLAPLGRAGVALLTVGAAGAIAGIGLAAAGKRERSAAGDIDEVDYRTPGLAVMGVGFAVLVAGAALLGVERRSARRRATASVVPRIDGRHAMIIWSGRF